MTEISDTRKKGVVFTKMKDQKAICISASNIVKNQKQSTSYYISEIIVEVLSENNISCEILDLREFCLTPCAGCDQCLMDRKCGQDAWFNRIYEKVSGADYLFFISPHCAPIPAKLSMLLEKMENMVSAHWLKGHTRKPKAEDMLAGIISYGEVGDEVSKDQTSAVLQEKLLSYKTMVNDIIADALNRMNLRTVPYNSKWNTGIVLPIGNDFQRRERIYDQKLPEKEIRQYVDVIVQTSKSLYAIY